MGPYLLLVLIDNFRTYDMYPSVPVHKFVDDTIRAVRTQVKLLESSLRSTSLVLGLRTTIYECEYQENQGDGFWPTSQVNLPLLLLVFNSKPVDRVHSFKLLGVVLNDSGLTDLG